MNLNYNELLEQAKLRFNETNEKFLALTKRERIISFVMLISFFVVIWRFLIFSDYLDQVKLIENEHNANIVQINEAVKNVTELVAGFKDPSHLNDKVKESNSILGDIENEFGFYRKNNKSLNEFKRLVNNKSWILLAYSESVNNNKYKDVVFKEKTYPVSVKEIEVGVKTDFFSFIKAIAEIEKIKGVFFESISIRTLKDGFISVDIVVNIPRIL